MGRRPVAVVVLGGLLVCLALVAVVAPRASSSPDGLERVAIDEGFAGREEAHDLEASPAAGYELPALGGGPWGTAAAGAIGVAATFTLGAGLLVALRRSGRGRRPPSGLP